MTQASTASALIDAMLADVGKTSEDYAEKAARTTERERLLDAALEWVYDQGCATALAEFERAAFDYTGRTVNGDD